MRFHFLGIMSMIGSLVCAGGIEEYNDRYMQSSAIEATEMNLEMAELVHLCGNTKQELVNFCKEYGIVLRSMEEGKLDYSMQFKLYGSISTICVDLEDEMIQEIYIKPGNTKLSVWVHRFTELYGDCIEIEKVPLKEQQEMKYITWLYEKDYISIVCMNQNMFIYITPCDN